MTIDLVPQQNPDGALRVSPDQDRINHQARSAVVVLGGLHEG